MPADAGLYTVLRMFAEGAGLGGGEPPDDDPDPETTAAMARIDQNLDRWLSHVVRPSFLGWTPDIPGSGPARPGSWSWSGRRRPCTRSPGRPAMPWPSSSASAR